MTTQLLLAPATAGKTAYVLDLGRTLKEHEAGAPIALEVNDIFHRTTVKVVKAHHR